MKTKRMLIGIIALMTIIGFTLAACDSDSGSKNEIVVGNTNGQLTITDLDSYNGKYVYAMGFVDSGDVLLCAKSIASNGYLTGGRISGDSVVLKVWAALSETSIGNYAGDGAAGIMVFISDSEVIDPDGDDELQISAGIAESSPDSGTVIFSSGVGNGAFVEWAESVIIVIDPDIP